MKLETIKKVREILNNLEYCQKEKIKWRECDNYSVTLHHVTYSPYLTVFKFLDLEELKKLAIQNLEKETLKLENELKVLTKELEYADKQETN